jgi:hypothetical protein
MVKKLLKLFSGSTPRPDDPATLVTAAHRSLQERLADREQRRVELERARAALQRVTQVIDGEAVARAALDAAEAAASEASRAWAASGATGNPAVGGAIEAVEAARVAHRKAQLLAEGARQGVGEAREVFEQAQRDLDSAGTAIREARTRLLIATAEDELREAESHAAAVREALANLSGLAFLLGGPFSHTSVQRQHIVGLNNETRPFVERVRALQTSLPPDETQWSALRAWMARVEEWADAESHGEVVH